MTKRTRYQRGMTLVEVAIASALMGMVVLLLVSVQIQVLRDFQRALNENTASRMTYNALRAVREQAQGAVQALVFGGGTEVRLFPPRRDSAGNILTPVQPDTANPIIVQVNYSAGTLMLTQNGATTTLLTGVRSTRPQGGSYVPFSVQQYAPGVQALQVRLSVQQGESHIWYEEMILLRNAIQN
ncbi:MAG: prepilin-type N-terminal cleavage/methylation domain-containing protein [Fimbriimonadales bacterium]|nr:prepilin-type N-terminal cleavage/methylation domain-containing protein [Fimbriimonadales bacterium]